jgi:hypothetical protein
VVRKRKDKWDIRENVPVGVDCINVANSRLFFDSGAFPEVRIDRRITPEQALNRQLEQLVKFPTQPRETWLVSYDRLIDEKFIGGDRKKERWSVEDAEEAVRQTVEAAQYFHSQRDRLSQFTLVQSCQGVDAAQYLRCVEEVLQYCIPNDVLGLGGWCILGKQKKWLPTFWETIASVVPLVAKAGITKIHIFGVTWWRSTKGFPQTPLGSLLWLCDKHGIALSCDGRSPIGNALWHESSGNCKKKAGALHPHWRVNLALTRTILATLRERPEYQAPPGYQLSINNQSINQTFSPTKAKAISLWQPWASLISIGKKKYETRHWPTSYRGKLLICAAKKKPKQAELDRFGLTPEDAPLGVAICICDLIDCIEMTEEFISQQTQLERDCGNWQPGRYAWKLENIQPVEPKPVRGYQGLWNIDFNFSPIKKKKGRGKQKKNPSGCLRKRIEKRKNSAGQIIEYPRVEGDRDENNPAHWLWNYEYSVKIGDKWKTKKKGVSRCKLDDVRNAIDRGDTISNILGIVG